MTNQADETPGRWADRPIRGDDGRAPVTNGASTGTIGAWFPRRAWPAMLGLIALVIFVNVMTALDDARRRGVALPISLPLTNEITSAIATLIALVIICATVRLAPPGRGPLWRTIAIHLGGSMAYSAAHIGLMTLFRILAFGAIGRAYPWTLGELPYEYRKDVITYVVMAGILWMFTRPGPASAAAETSPITFDIRDGATILRVPVREILAVQAAGNYVEFALEDGRRPLMRASMARIEAALGPHGFVRSHRSWLVNARRVRALSAAGSGDFRIDLDAGVAAPLSRRYPTALARLRGE
jgi:hypothetical protein